MFPLFRMALIQFSYRVEDKIRIKKKKKKKRSWQPVVKFQGRNIKQSQSTDLRKVGISKNTWKCNASNTNEIQIEVFKETPF